MGDHATNPSPVNMCPHCATECLPTPAGVAYHRARHLDWVKDHATPRRFTDADIDRDRAQAWRAYSRALDDVVSHLNGEVGKRDDMIAERDSYISDLEADLIHVRNELHDVCNRVEEAL